jgi:hypothetical protein
MAALAAVCHFSIGFASLYLHDSCLGFVRVRRGRRNVYAVPRSLQAMKFLRETLIWGITVALAVVTGWIWVLIISNL